MDTIVVFRGDSMHFASIPATQTKTVSLHSCHLLNETCGPSDFISLRTKEQTKLI